MHENLKCLDKLRYDTTTLLMCYFWRCFHFLCVFVCSVLMILNFWYLLKIYPCTSCKFWKSYFSKIFQRGKIVVHFGLIVLWKITWSVQNVLVKKWHMWDQMSQHVCNIWTLSADHDRCYSERIFLVMFQSDLLISFRNAFIRFVWMIKMINSNIFGVCWKQIKTNSSTNLDVISSSISHWRKVQKLHFYLRRLKPNVWNVKVFKIYVLGFILWVFVCIVVCASL